MRRTSKHEREQQKRHCHMRSENIMKSLVLLLLLLLLLVLVLVVAVVVVAVVVGVGGRDPPVLYITTPDRPPLRLLC